MKSAALLDALRSGRADAALSPLYGAKAAVLAAQRGRYAALLEKAAGLFPGPRDFSFYSTPGRSEVGGNHTDHNGGRVLAAAVDLDVVAAVAPNDEGIIRLHSEGYPPSTIDVRELEVREDERLTSAALIRGVCAGLHRAGYRLGGFDGCATSNVLKGSGLSSSAAFEVLIASILNHLYNDGRVPAIQVAQISQYSENRYFGKPCGLMDQTTCAVGGFVAIDFQDFAHPLVRQVAFDFAASGLAMVIVDTGGSHADLNDDYTALEHEMKDIARALGGRVLREVSARRVLEEVPRLRKEGNDRAILRALHFYADDQRVVDQVAALERNDLARFLELINESGRSSWMLCQNCYSSKDYREQGISIALAVSEDLLAGRGAWRVHGGGFAGTIQAFVPQDLLAAYVERLQAIFGPQSCYQLSVRPAGALRLDIAQ